MKKILMLFYIAVFSLLLFFIPPVRGAEKTGYDMQVNSEIFIKLLGEQLSGQAADYMNSSPEWQLIMESRIRLSMFTYWVNVMHFGVARVEMIEKRFGELVQVVEENKAFQRTFIEPNFIKVSNLFPVHGFVSSQGKRFEIKSIEEFEALNKEFIVFLKTCVDKTDASK
jgi:hypothetical protein